MEASRNIFTQPMGRGREVDPEAPRSVITDREHAMGRLVLDGDIDCQEAYSHILPPEGTRLAGELIIATL